MRKLLIVLLFILLFVQPVCALEFNQPAAPKTVDDLVPHEVTNFTEDLIHVLKIASKDVKPEIIDALQICIRILVISLLHSILTHIVGKYKFIVCLIAVVTLGVIMLQSVNTMAGLGASTIEELSDYGKLLLPVMTAAMAAQGATNTAASLYAGTAAFSVILTSLISKILIPVLYLYMCCCVANHAIGEYILKRVCRFLKWFLTWSLRIILYVFTGYLTITGVISGSVDASAIKAAKLAISGAVPVVGNILADASDTILLSAGLMKNSAGIYGLIVFISILVGPFIKIAVQYCMLKMTAAISGAFNETRFVGLINDFSSCMGFVLAMTGSVCLLFMISIVCFLKGVS